MSATILHFRLRPANRMTRHDRYDVVDWADRAAEAGYTRVAFDSSGDDNDPELGDFVLIYGHGQMWASWGVGRRAGKYIVWRSADGQNLVIADTIREALAVIPPFAASRLTA